jgi:hypothetical protein
MFVCGTCLHPLHGEPDPKWGNTSPVKPGTCKACGHCQKKAQKATSE